MSRRTQRDPDSGRLWKVVGLLALAALVGSILWSMWVDTLLPLIRAGDSRAVLLHLIGLPLILLGVSVFVYGGYVFVRNTYGAFGDETLRENLSIVQTRPSPEAVGKARRQNLRLLWEAWKPGLAWMTFGFLLLAAGGFLINR